MSTESKGLGDTIAKFTHALGIDKVADAVAKLAGAEGCGCNERQQYLNELFPYASYTRKFKALKAFSGVIATTENTTTYQHFQEGEIVEINNQHPMVHSIIWNVEQGNLEEII